MRLHLGCLPVATCAARAKAKWSSSKHSAEGRAPRGTQLRRVSAFRGRCPFARAKLSAELVLMHAITQNAQEGQLGHHVQQFGMFLSGRTKHAVTQVGGEGRQMACLGHT